MSKKNQRKTKHKPSGKEGSASASREAALNQAPKQPLPKWKIALFRTIIIFVSPILFFGLLEFGLALAGIGFPTGFYVSAKQNGEKVFQSNPHFIQTYFGSGVSKECMPFAIPKKKPDNTVRLFLLGASAAQGDPDPAYGMGRQLEVMLQEQYPDQRIEVHNVAIAAINSHVVLPIMRACADMDPDLFIIYLGNNEVVGPYGSGSVFSSMFKSRWLIALHARLRGSRFGQWVGANFRKGNGQPEEWNGMEMFLNNPVTQDDPRMQTVYKHYRNNLRAMFRIGIKHDVPVVISTVAVNLKDNAPFGSRHKASLADRELERWQDNYARGIEMQKQNRFDQALELFREALKLDGHYADLHFRMAECYLATGQPELAEGAYEQARDLDVYRFRADSTINQIIKETAAGFEDVVFIDGREVVHRHSPDGIPGTELFYEHVHYNFSGNYLMAKTLNPAVLRSLEVKKGIKPRSREILSEAEVKRRLAYTRWDHLKITRFILERLGKPPFTGQSDIDKQQAKLKEEISAINAAFSDQELQDVLAGYEYALHHYPHWFLYDHLADIHFNATGNLPLAEEYYQKALDQYPDYTIAMEALAHVKMVLGKLGEAEALFRKSLASQPTVAQKKVNLAVVIGAQERYGEAIALLREVVAEHAYIESGYFNLAVYLFNQAPNDPANQKEAAECWQTVLEHNPDYLEARYGLANIYQRQGQTAQAMKELEINLAKDPDHQPSRNLLEQLKNKPR